MRITSLGEPLKKLIALVVMTTALATSGCTQSQAPETNSASAAYGGHCAELYGAGSALYNMNNFLAVSGGYEKLTAEQRKKLIAAAGYSTVNDYLLTSKETPFGAAWGEEATTEAEKAELMNVMVLLSRYKSNFYKHGYDSSPVLAELSAAAAVIGTKCSDDSE
jgi:hypothetical protein